MNTVMQATPRASLLDGAELLTIDPAEIDTGGRIGFLHADKAEALGRLMLVDGQRDAIKVTPHPKKGSDKPWLLVTGLHRTQGAAAVGIPVRALVVKGKPEELADMEASENLHRRPLAPIERAKFVAALCDAARTRIARENGDVKQQAAAIKARWARVKAGETRVDDALREESEDTSGKLCRAYGWQESAADAFGLSIRSIRSALALHRLIIEPFPDLVEPLARHPVVGENASQLQAIADVKDEARRRRVIETLLKLPECSAEDARVLAGVDAPAGPAPAPSQRFYDQISGGWSRLGTADKRRFLPELVKMIPGEMKRDLRDRLNAELGEPGRPSDMREALDKAFTLLIALSDGEPVDDEAIADALDLTQRALDRAVPAAEPVL